MEGWRRLPAASPRTSHHRERLHVMRSTRPIPRLAWLALAALPAAAPLAAAPPALDPSFGGFGSGGSVVTSSLRTIDWVQSDDGAPLAVQGDGRILVAGRRGRE